MAAYAHDYWGLSHTGSEDRTMKKNLEVNDEFRLREDETLTRSFLLG